MKSKPKIIKFGLFRRVIITKSGVARYNNDNTTSTSWFVTPGELAQLARDAKLFKAHGCHSSIYSARLKILGEPVVFSKFTGSLHIGCWEIQPKDVIRVHRIWQKLYGRKGPRK